MGILLRAGVVVLSLNSAALRADTSQLNDIAQRVAGRSYPSIFQAWSPADNLAEDATTTLARHDLYWNGPTASGLSWDTSGAPSYSYLATGFTSGSLATAQQYRANLLSRNPKMVMMAEVRYRDTKDGTLPADSSWWLRDGSGNRIVSWSSGSSTYYRLDLTRADVQAHVAAQAQSVIQSGVYDGVMLDWWDESEYASSRLALVQAVRSAIGNQALIIVNANDRQIPVTGQYVNGLFMECYDTSTAAKWSQIATTLAWAEKNLKSDGPRINALETWYHTSRNDLNLMRATTTLGLTTSDGYTLFSDPNTLSTPDHLHDWYSFYDTNLGTPVAKGVAQTDGTRHRDFTYGTAVYNPMGNGAKTVTFAQARTSAATGVTGTTFTVSDTDGDLFLLPAGWHQDVSTSTSLRNYSNSAGAKQTLTGDAAGATSKVTTGTLLNPISVFGSSLPNAQLVLTEDATSGAGQGGSTGVLKFQVVQAPTNGSGSYGFNHQNLAITLTSGAALAMDDLGRVLIDFDLLLPSGASLDVRAEPNGGSYSERSDFGRLTGSGQWQHYSFMLAEGSNSANFLSYVNGHSQNFRMTFADFSGMTSGDTAYLDNLNLTQQALVITTPEPSAGLMLMVAGSLRMLGARPRRRPI